MRTKTMIALAALLCGLLIVGGGVWAMTSTNYAINWNVIGGGGEPASSDNYNIRSTIGQPAAETSSSTNYQLGSGYWHEIAPLAENTPPVVSNVVASQGLGTGTVDISYDVTDADQATATISFEYWDGSTWQDCITTTGDGSVSIGAGKEGTWDAKTDFDGQYLADCKIKVIANDGQASNNIGEAESTTVFALDTRDPTGYGCSTPANDATDVSVNPTLTALAASDDSPPISYWFILAEDAVFTQGIQESGWQQDDNTWLPPTALNYEDDYWWKVKARDAYGNEGDYSAAFKFTTSPAGPGIAWIFPSTSEVFLGPTPANSRPYLDAAVSLPTGTEPAQLSGVYWLDEATGEWRYFVPAFGGGTLTSLEPGQAYLMAVSGSCSWNLPCGEGAALPTGNVWNFPCTSDVFLGPAPANTRPYLDAAVTLPTGTEPEQLSGVYWLDEATGEWQYFVPAFGGGTLTSLEPGQAYLMAVSGPCGWPMS